MRKSLCIGCTLFFLLFLKGNGQSLEGEKAISHAVEYIEGRGGEFLPDVQLMVYWLNRKYSLPLTPQWKQQVEEMVHNPVWRESQLRYYFRVVDPSISLTQKELDEGTGFNWLTARALYCDKYFLGQAFLDSLYLYNRGSYDRTHAAFALYWALEKECISPGDLGNFQHELEDGLVELIQERGADTDVGIEAMAMLLQFGRHDMIQHEWIDGTLLPAQRPDGSWAEKPEVDQSNDHTTALALWVLLEWYFPDTPEMPWVDFRHDK